MRLLRMRRTSLLQGRKVSSTVTGSGGIAVKEGERRLGEKSCCVRLLKTGMSSHGRREAPRLQPVAWHTSTVGARRCGRLPLRCPHPAGSGNWGRPRNSLAQQHSSPPWARLPT